MTALEWMMTLCSNYSANAMSTKPLQVYFLCTLTHMNTSNALKLHGWNSESTQYLLHLHWHSARVNLYRLVQLAMHG